MAESGEQKNIYGSTPVTRFLSTFARANKNSLVTHTSMAGGSYSLPDTEEEREGLIKAMVECLRYGQHYFIVEQRPQCFRLPVDIDDKRGSPISDDERIEMASVVVRAVYDIFKEPPTSLSTFAARAVIAFAPVAESTEEVMRPMTAYEIELEERRTGTTLEPEKAVKRETRTTYKYGCHVIFPDIYIDNRYGNIIRVKCIAELERVYGPRSAERGENSWADVIDHRLYEAVGLRPLGADKSEMCRAPVHNGQRGFVACNRCQGAKRIFIGRPYSVAAVLDGNGSMLHKETTLLKNDFAEALRQTLLRSNKTLAGDLCPDVTAVSQLPCFDKYMKDTGNKPLPHGQGKKLDGTVENQQERLIYWDRSGEVPVNTPEFETIARWFASPGNLEETPIVVETVYLATNKRFYDVFVKSGQCRNLNRRADGSLAYHNSNNVYFRLTRDGVKQLCHCKCVSSSKWISVDGKQTPCRYYKSEIYRWVPDNSGSSGYADRKEEEILKILFPRRENAVYDQETRLRNVLACNHTETVQMLADVSDYGLRVAPYRPPTGDLGIGDGKNIVVPHPDTMVQDIPRPAFDIPQLQTSECQEKLRTMIDRIYDTGAIKRPSMVNNERPLDLDDLRLVQQQALIMTELNRLRNKIGESSKAIGAKKSKKRSR